MATVTELVDLICEDTGLDPSGTSSERDIALRRLNHASRQIAQAFGGVTDVPDVPFQLPLAVGTKSVSLISDATLASRFHTIRSVQLYENGTLSEPLTQVPMHQILLAQKAGLEGNAKLYSYEYPTVSFDAAGDSNGSSVAYAMCTLIPLSLVESAPVATVSESTPTSLVPAWHESLLAKLATCIIMEGYDGREQDAAYHRALYREALMEYREWRIMSGGRTMPEDPTNMKSFDTSSPIRTR